MRILLPLVVLLFGAAPYVAWADEKKPDEPALYEGRPAAEWVTELGKDDVAARRKAAYALFELGPAARTAAAVLAKALDDDDAYVRDTSCRALILLRDDARPALQSLRSVLDDGRPRARQLALWAMLRIDPKTVFRDEDLDVRKAGLRIMADPNGFFTEAVFNELLGLIPHEDGEIRTWTAQGIAMAYMFPAIDRPYLVSEKAPLVERLSRMASKDEEPLARRGAVYALQQLTRYPKGRDLSDRIRPVLIEATRDESAEVRVSAFLSLSATGKSEEAESACLVGVKDADVGVRATASGGLAFMSEGGPRVVTALIALLADEDRFVRYGAARSLGCFGERSAAAVPALRERFRVEPFPDTFARALGDIGPAARPALPQLEVAFTAAREPSAEVAYALLRLGSLNHEPALRRLVDVALSDLGGQAQVDLGKLGATAAPALPRIIDALVRGKPGTEGQPGERLRAAWILRAMGPAATPAVCALVALLKDEATMGKELATAARDALREIRGA